MSETQTVKDGTEENEAAVIPDAPFLTGAGGGTWHAISRESMAYLRTSDVDSVAFAECGELVRVAAKYGTYDRTSVPVTYHPCQVCAWTVAAKTGTLDAEAGLLVPLGKDLDALIRGLPDPRIAADTAQALLRLDRAEREDDDDRARLVQLLATVAAHAPVLLVEERCAEGECDHEAEGEPCPGSVACAACSLQEGDWAGEWAGHYRLECTIPAPCPVLLALAEHARSQQ